MKYNELGTSINNKLSPINSTIEKVKNMSFDSIWTGKSSAKLTSNVKDAVNALEICKNNIKDFMSAMQLLETYKKNKEAIAALERELSSLSDKKEDAARASSIRAKISEYVRINKQLRQEIESILSSFKPIASKMHLIGHQPSQNDFIVNVDEFNNLFKNNELSKISDGNSLYNYYSQEEIERELNKVKSTYSGREASVNSLLCMMKMAADAGLKLDYDFGGGHTSVTDMHALANGSDCSSFVSWGINQGSKDTFYTQTTAGLKNTGTEIDYSNAKPGDILVTNNGQDGHVVMVVENNPKDGNFIVVEAKGSKDGVVMSEKSYSSLKNGAYHARDLTDVYGV